VIPEAAVEAALSALFHGKKVHGFTRAVQEPIIRTILEAAAPHMRAAIQAEVLVHARAVITPTLCTAEKWRHKRVCDDFQEMIDAATSGKLASPE
jgi:hypothetical protein